MASPGLLRLQGCAVYRWLHRLRDLQGEVPAAGPLCLGTRSPLPILGLPPHSLVAPLSRAALAYRGRSWEDTLAQGSEKSLSEVRGSHFLDLKEEGAGVDLGSPRVLPDSGTHEPSPEIQEGNTRREEGSFQAPPKARGDRPTT